MIPERFSGQKIVIGPDSRLGLILGDFLDIPGMFCHLSTDPRGDRLPHLASSEHGSKIFGIIPER